MAKRSDSIRVCYYGLGPITIRIAEFDYMKEVREKVLLFKEIGQEEAFHLFE